MPLEKQPLTWPLTGGLATNLAPLSVQPGSHVTLDNVVQERVNEWRRRNGFTQTSADTLAGFGLVWPTAGTGMVSLGGDGLATYMPTLTSSKWSTATTPRLTSWSRTSVTTSRNERTMVGFAAAGSVAVLAMNGATTGTQTAVVHDLAGGTGRVVALVSFLRVRCVATSTHLVVVGADSSGNLRVYVIDAATGAATGPTTIKAGMHATQPYLDAHYYGGSTVTIVCRESGNQVRFIEFNPSTGANTADALIAVNADNCVSLMMDPDASGVRFIGISNAAPSTRIIRADNVGNIVTNDQLEAVDSTQIAGCGYNNGGDWKAVYRTTAPVIRFNSRVSGSVGSPSTLTMFAGADGLYIDSQAWRDTTETTRFKFLAGIHRTTPLDEQDTLVECEITQGDSTGATLGDLIPLQAAPASSLNASLYQVQRISSGVFRVGIPRQTRFARDGATVSRIFALDVWTETYVSASNLSTLNLGHPVQTPGTVVFPGGAVRSHSGAQAGTNALAPIGTLAAPRQVGLIASGGGSLTPDRIYTYQVVLEHRDAVGNTWRSPPSVPNNVTMGPSDTRVSVVFTNWTLEVEAGSYSLAIFRSAGNGSVLKRIATYEITAATTSVTHVDNASDASIVSGDVLYTTGELPTALTPPATHVAAFGDRLWLVNRDFPTELWFSKNIRPGVQPEFTDEFVIDIDDDKGDITGLGVMDDKLVVFKRNAIYIVQGGETLGNNGAGQFPVVTRIDGDLGAIVGSPIVSCGSEVYFVADRGIYSIDRAVNVAWVGAEVDQYLHQPLVQTVETITDGVFVSEMNEVRFTTTSYVLVYNRDAKTWVRWTGLSGMTRALVIGGRMVMFRASDGTVWREGDHTQTTDQGVAYSGVIRSAWIRPAGLAGRLRLYKAGIVSTRTAGGGNIVPQLNVYMDNSDTVVQTASPTSATFGVVPGSATLLHPFVYPRTQKCQAFALELTLPSGDLTFRLDGWTTVIGVAPGAQKRAAAERWA